MAEIFPLADRAVPGLERQAAGASAIEISECRPRSIAELALWQDDAALVARLAAAVAGGEAPAAGRAAIGESAMFFATGPARYLAISTAEGVAETLTGLVPVEAGAVVDLTHGRTGLRISGPRAADLVQKGLSFDLGGAAFPVGAVANAGLHHMGVVVIRTGDEAFDLFVAASYAGSLWDWATDSAVEYGFKVVAPVA